MLSFFKNRFGVNVGYNNNTVEIDGATYLDIGGEDKPNRFAKLGEGKLNREDKQLYIYTYNLIIGKNKRAYRNRIPQGYISIEELVSIDSLWVDEKIIVEEALRVKSPQFFI